MNLRRLHRGTWVAAVFAATCLVSVATIAQNQNTAPNQAAEPQQTPPWAYPLGPGVPPPSQEPTPHRVPGSTQAFTEMQIRDLFNVADWFPGDHLPMPDIVKVGRRPDVRACGYCHLPNGQGRPENAGIAGLPAAYIAQQMADWKNGLRKSAEPSMGPPATMLTIGKAATDAEVQAAAEYFSQLKFQQWIRVVESSTVPKTRVLGSMLVAAEGGGTEPIGDRIIEMPEDLKRTELRDPRSGFVAYVPMGSIKKGEALVTTGGGRTIRCGICHGPDLKGLGNVPSLAGRSPSYTVRQLYDIQSGARKGPWTALMKEAVAQLTLSDMVSIAAYTASRTP